MTQFNKQAQATVWVQGYLWRKPRTLNNIIRDSPYPSHFTAIAVQLLAYSLDGTETLQSKYTLHDQNRKLIRP